MRKQLFSILQIRTRGRPTAHATTTELFPRVLLFFCLIKISQVKAFSLPIYFDSSNHLHRSLSYHPEQPARIEACISALQEEYQQRSEIISLVDVSNKIPNSNKAYASNAVHQPFSQQELDHARNMLLKIHAPELVTGLEQRCRDSRQRRIEEGKDPLGFVGWIDDDTFVTTETYDVCLRATAAWIRAVDYVHTQHCCLSSTTRSTSSSAAAAAAASSAPTIPTAMALTRPPGHHATASQSNGFCLFNFAAAAAIHYLDIFASASGEQQNQPKISILDWDVHYGQGVADIVSKKYPQSIRYASIHQIPAFPYMGTKRGIQNNNILTMPMVADTTWTCGYQQYFQDALEFLFEHDRWEPDLVIVCAGYDALDSDELASVGLNAKDFGKMTRLLQDKIRAQQQQQQSNSAARLMLGMEGGYQLSKMAGGGNLQQAVIETVNALIE